MFSEDYGRRRLAVPRAREGRAVVPESVVQCVWYDHLFSDRDLRTDDDRTIRVVSPGWWNQEEGPDFRGAQLEIDGTLRSGDVEVHLDHGAWRGHGHHLDSRYDDVILVVVLARATPSNPPTTSLGRRIPCLLLPRYLEEDIHDLAEGLSVDAYPYDAAAAAGQCAAFVEAHGADPMARLLALAGEWRMLAKARALRIRADKVGADQALYEAFLSACGFSRYKTHLRVIAEQLPYERVRQLARRDPLLLETAFLQLAGLLPGALPEGTSAVPHFARLRGLRRDALSGLRSLPLTWKRIGVRPNNYPERRLAGAARFLARTSAQGLSGALLDVWRTDLRPVDRRRAFEALFPSPMGFWATHCSWTGKKLAKPVSLLGGGRVRSITGNVIVPAGLAHARRTRDRLLEERVLEFFAAMPKEPDNKILKAMGPRVFGDATIPRGGFQLQQGMLQIYHDWCASNPSCRNCSMMALFDAPGVVE